MRKLFFLILGLLFLTFFSKVVYAQINQKTPEEIAKEKGVIFPIAELGNCKSYYDCRNYCEDPVNMNVCVSFAKKKGFYKEPQVSQQSEVLKSAQTELGCNSFSSCQAFCSQSVNYDKCASFAKVHKLNGGGTTDPSSVEILNKAKDFLGCTSAESCKNLCAQDINKQKCSDFAKQVGLRGGEQQLGPGGCTSEETCRKFCSDPNNFEICQKFQESVTGQSRSFHGPGGCSDQESCKTYCEKNPQNCQSVPSAMSNPQETCSKTPSCSWNGNTCQCNNFQPGTSSAIPIQNINSQDYCKQYPERCNFQKPLYPNHSSYPSPSTYPSYLPYPTVSSYPNYSPYPASSNSPISPYTIYPSPTTTSTVK